MSSSRNKISINKTFFKKCSQKNFWIYGGLRWFWTNSFFHSSIFVLHFLLNYELSFLYLLICFSLFFWDEMHVYIFISLCFTNWVDFFQFGEVRDFAVFWGPKPHKFQKKLQLAHFSTKLAEILRKHLFCQVVWVYQFAARLENNL